MSFKKNKVELETNGYSITSKIYSDDELNKIINLIESKDSKSDSFIKTKDLFAIRQFFKNLPELSTLVFNNNMLNLLNEVGSDDYFLSKAIYFDKPKESNWFVAYHQDLSISVNEKTEEKDYINWTFKRGQYGVQPPIKILENIITIRVHLDDTTSENGALSVIPNSHSKGIYRPESIDWNKETEVVCEVKKGNAMLMKPLTLHASKRTLNDKQRRVIHMEFSNQELEGSLEWLEKFNLKKTIT